MKNKMVKLFMMFVLLSLQGFSQADEKSEHPLLDKYYPQKQTPGPAKTITTQTPILPDIKSISETKPAPVPKVMPETPPPAPTKSISGIEPVAAAKDTTAVYTPTNIAVPVPVLNKTQPKHPSTPYIDTRLGSSSPLYDTYEKNTYGAGSVTTNPK